MITMDRKCAEYVPKVVSPTACRAPSSNYWQGHKYLVHENGLDTQPAKKTQVYIEDIGPFNETILSTQENNLHLGFQRIQVSVFNSLGLFTVHRQNALQGLQFKDIQISLQKDPHNGPPVRLIELTASGTKKFLR